MKVVGRENIEARVKEIAENLCEDNKNAIEELLFYYRCSLRDNTFHEKNTKMLHQLCQDSFTRGMQLASGEDNCSNVFSFNTIFLV